jgi:hypothetical protein
MERERERERLPQFLTTSNIYFTAGRVFIFNS